MKPFEAPKNKVDRLQLLWTLSWPGCSIVAQYFIGVGIGILVLITDVAA